MIWLFCAAAHAATLTGFSLPSAEKSYTIDSKVEQVVEAKDRFLVGFSNRPAFYEFPKVDASLAETRRALLEAAKKHSKAHVFINANTAQILKLELR